MSRIIISMGFIPGDWVGDKDGDVLIQCGDPGRNRTAEADFEIEEGRLRNLASGEAIKITPKDYWNADSALWTRVAAASSQLGRGESLSSEMIKNAWAAFQGELEEDVDGLLCVAEGEAEFRNADGAYNGAFYVRFRTEEDDGEAESVFVLQ